MVWDLLLPRLYFRFHIQAWDRDFAKWSDCLGETQLDLGPHIRRALRNPAKALQVLCTDDEQLKQKQRKLEEMVRGRVRLRASAP